MSTEDMRRTVRCLICKAHTRVERIGMPTSAATIAPFKYCTACGSPQVRVYIDTESDFWDNLASDYNTDTATIRECYSQWDSKEFPSFADFMRSLIREARNAS